MERVESRDLIRRLHFGGLVLLQPELLGCLCFGHGPGSQGGTRRARIHPEDAHSRGIPLAAEERISDQTQEKLLLIATVEELLRHEIALKETTDQGVDFAASRPSSPGSVRVPRTFLEGRSCSPSTDRYEYLCQSRRPASSFQPVPTPDNVAERCLIYRDSRRQLWYPLARTQEGRAS